MGGICSKEKPISNDPQSNSSQALAGKQAELATGEWFKTGFWQNYKQVNQLNKNKSLMVVSNIITEQNRVVLVENQAIWVGRESKLLQLLEIEHQHLVKILEVYWENGSVYIVQEYISSGKLIDQIVKSKCKTENHIALIMKQLLSAIGALHKVDLYHGQSNIIIRGHQVQTRYQLMGSLSLNLQASTPVIQPFQLQILSRQMLRLLKRLSNLYQTVFKAPELLVNKAEPPNLKYADIWACGITLHFLLTGQPPFDSVSETGIQKQIVRGMVNFDESHWMDVSKEAKSFLQSLLTYKGSERPTAQSMLSNKWLLKSNRVQKGKRIAHNVITQLKRQQTFSIIQQASMHYMIDNVLNQQEKDELIQQFEVIDKNNDGVLSKEEVLLAYSKRMSKERALLEIEQLFSSLGPDHHGLINYSDFVCAVYSSKKMFTEESLSQTFNLLDQDHNGALNYQEFAQLLRNFHLTPQQIKEYTNQIDKNQDGQITLDEFKGLVQIINEDREKTKEKKIEVKIRKN